MSRARRGAAALAVVVALGLAAVLGGPGVARADPEDELGLSPKAAALGDAVSAVPIGFASVHYDPATLAPGGDEDAFVEASLSLVAAHPAVWIEGVDGHTITPPSKPDDLFAAVIGARFDLGHLVGLHGINAAVSVYTPVRWVFRYALHPDDSMQWLMLTDRTQHISIEGGVGVRVTPWLSLGASVHVLFDFEGYTTGYVTDVHNMPDPTGAPVISADTNLGESVRVYGHAAPIVGALITPLPGLRFGLTWRGAIYADDWGWAKVEGKTGLGEIGYIYRFAHYYRPHEFDLGASYRVLPTLRVSADLSLELWSGGLTNAHAALGPGRFGNTLVPALGVSWTVKPGIEAMMGYRFVRTPFDNLGGPTNLLDTDQHEVSLGGELRLDELAGVPFHLAVDASVRLAGLVTHTETKDWRRFASDARLQANPGYPGYRFGGLVPSAQLGVEARW